MALELRPGKSKWWYGRVAVNGRRMVKNLGVEVSGTVPPSLAQTGDIVFERSRAKAQAALEKLQFEVKKKHTSEELVQMLHEVRTGSRICSIPFDDMYTRWLALPRRRAPSERYLKLAETWLKRFAVFVKASNAALRDMDQAQCSHCRAFLHAEEERGITAKTYNNELIFLRAVFNSLRRDAGLAENPFDGIPTREVDTIHRKPFTEDELALIEEKARADEFVYPLIVTGICTAMRKGDCCQLLRRSVDLDNGFLAVKTSKTNEDVQIPIFPLLRRVLEKAKKDSAAETSPYVFPKLAAHYAANPDHLTDRVRRVMRAAGFFDIEAPVAGNAHADTSRSVTREREVGLRKASVRDFHSFRVTWVTMALNAGVPIEVVQKVTGHRTSSIVTKHYFRPVRENLRQTLSDRLPAFLTT
jgi:integrase